MNQAGVFMDNHSTTPVDQRVVEAMQPLWTQVFGNPGSTSHAFGWEAKAQVDAARQRIAALLSAEEREIVFTSGATESNNLALKGVVARALARADRQQPPHIVSVTSEHKAVLDPLTRLGRDGVSVTLVSPRPQGDLRAGLVDVEEIANAMTDETVLVSVMMANNEIGVIQPISDIAAVCHERGALFHSDATQAVGRLPVDVGELQVDLMSFSATQNVRPQRSRWSLCAAATGLRATPASNRGRGPGIRNAKRNAECAGDRGDGQGVGTVCGRVGFGSAASGGLARSIVARSGTENPTMPIEWPPLGCIWSAISRKSQRGFCRCGRRGVDAQHETPGGIERNACTSANPEPSHVLQAIGLSEDLTRSSLRFGLGRFNTAEDVSLAVDEVHEAVVRLRALGGA